MLWVQSCVWITSCSSGQGRGPWRLAGVEAQHTASFKGSFLRDFLLKAAIVWLRESHIHSAPSGILEHACNTEKNDDSKIDLMIKSPPTPHKFLWLSSGREMSCWKLNLVHLGSGGNPVFKINMRVLFEVVCSSKAQLLCLYYAWCSLEMQFNLWYKILARGGRLERKIPPSTKQNPLYAAGQVGISSSESIRCFSS